MTTEIVNEPRIVAARSSVSNFSPCIEVSNNSDAWEELATEVIGTPVNIKFNDFFKIEKLTILGDASDSLRKKIAPMSPEYRSYKVGFTSKK